MSISHRVSIRWLPDPASEPTSTIVLTSPERRFIDLRLTLTTPQSLYWGFAGTSLSPTPTSGMWIHTLDSRSDEPDVDKGELEVLEDGDVLERGAMVDFEDSVRKEYEEVWRDEKLERGERVALVLETEGGLVVRVGRWVQGLLKRGDEVRVERWRGEECLFASGGERVCGDEVWERGRVLEVGEEVSVGGVRWRVVERSCW